MDIICGELSATDVFASAKTVRKKLMEVDLNGRIPRNKIIAK